MKVVTTLLVTACLFATVQKTWAHCEIPCGIYDDRARIERLREHCDTIEKSMKQAVELGRADQKNYNQLVRWINNKELHANKAQEIVYQYFMTQRVSPVEDKTSPAYGKYVKQVTLLHGMLVSAMKAKQTTDTAHVDHLRKLIDKFEALYFDSDEEHSHKEKMSETHGH